LIFETSAGFIAWRKDRVTDTIAAFGGQTKTMSPARSPQNLAGVFAVPPLARKNDLSRGLDFQQNDLVVAHILSGGITRLIYGGNAFIYHISLSEFEELIEWLTHLPDDVWVIPSIGPSYGRAIDQAKILRRNHFPCAMVLPSGDPRDASGLERGYREIAEVANCKLMLYLKDENNFGPNKEEGLEAVGRLVDEGICQAIKYAVVREHTDDDPYLDALLKRVDSKYVISGIGERPAIQHLRNWKLPGFTTGSGCIAPNLSNKLFQTCEREDSEAAEKIRSIFIPMEDLRDAWGPARVLHSATELAGIAQTGPIPPYVSSLSQDQIDKLLPVVRTLHLNDSDGEG
jgi:dihydrodipicolinate synthase/N-acetylneuraminate lyase